MRNFLIKHYIATTAIVAVVVVLGFYFFKFHYQLSDDNGNWGTFGDFFGGTLNPILSFLALMVLLRTFSMQREALDLQSKELDLQREELKDTHKILNEQKETQKRQQFENTFFELLKVHNQVLNDLEPLAFNFKFSDDSASLEYVKAVFNNCTELKEHYYFRVLYQLLKFISVYSENKIDEQFKKEEIERDDVSYKEKMYSNIVRAILSDDIVELIAIKYCDFDIDDEHGYRRTKALIERYSFLEREFFNLKTITDKPLYLRELRKNTMKKHLVSTKNLIRKTHEQQTKMLRKKRRFGLGGGVH